MPQLRVVSGNHTGQVVDLVGDSMRLGRDCPDGLQLLDHGVSRHHAEVFRIGDMYFLRDLQSRNGVWLNDERIIEELLQAGDRIRMGSAELLFEPGGRSDRAMAASGSDDAFGTALDEGEPGDHTLTLELDLGLPDDEAEAARDYRYLTAIYRLGQHVAVETSQSGLFRELLKVAGEAVGADAAWVIQRRGQSFAPRAEWSTAGRESPGARVISGPLVREVLGSGKAMLTRDDASERSSVCAPLAVREKVLGVAWFHRAGVSRAFTRDDLELIAALALQTGVALDAIRGVQRQSEKLMRTVRALTDLVDQRWPGRRGRARRVLIAAAAIGEELDLPTAERRWIELAALLHDVGSLTLIGEEGEPARTERLVHASERFVAGLGGLDATLPAIRNQYALFDGSGWPAEVAAGDVPMSGRVLAVARAFAELTDTPGESGEPASEKEAVVRMQAATGRFDTDALRALANAVRHSALGHARPVVRLRTGDDADGTSRSDPQQ